MTETFCEPNHDGCSIPKEVLMCDWCKKKVCKNHQPCLCHPCIELSRPQDLNAFIRKDFTRGVVDMQVLNLLQQYVTRDPAGLITQYLAEPPFQAPEKYSSSWQHTHTDQGDWYWNFCVDAKPRYQRHHVQVKLEYMRFSQVDNTGPPRINSEITLPNLSILISHCHQTLRFRARHPMLSILSQFMVRCHDQTEAVHTIHGLRSLLSPAALGVSGLDRLLPYISSLVNYCYAQYQRWLEYLDKTNLLLPDLENDMEHDAETEEDDT